jgi:hypothetical protein
MQELWEKLNQPQIKLETGEKVATMSVGDGPNKMELRADGPSGATMALPVSEKTAESLARSISRLERMMGQVSDVAEQVSDVGTLIGRAMVVLNDSLESQSGSEKPIAGVAPRKPAEPAPAAAMVDAKVKVAAAQTSAELDGEPQVDAVDSSSDGAPAWIDDPPTRIGNTWRQVIIAGDYATIDECNRVADIYLLLATYNHLQQLIGNSLSDESLPALSLRGDDVYAGGEPVVLAGRPADHRLKLLATMGIGVD